MITEFTCGIYTAKYAYTGAFKWAVLANNYLVAIIDSNGALVSFKDCINPLLTQDDLIEIAVLMNNIKRQYKQLQTNS
jgi:hypothetical protein